MAWADLIQKLCDEGGFRLRFYSDGEWWERWDRELVPLLLEVAKAAQDFRDRKRDGLDRALAALDEWAQRQETNE